MNNNKEIVCRFCNTKYPKNHPIVYSVDDNNNYYHCPVCDSVFLAPVVRLFAKYNSKYNLAFYRLTDIRKAGIFACEIGQIAQENFKNPRILEIGGGNGLTQHLLKEAGFSAFGVEYDHQWASILEQKYNMIVYPGSFENMQMPQSFNLVFSSHVIEHSYTPYLFLKRCFSTIRKGGIVIVDTPDSSLAQSNPDNFKHFHTRNIGEHVCILSRKTLEYFCSKNNCEIIDYRPHSEYQSFFCVLRKLGYDYTSN